MKEHIKILKMAMSNRLPRKIKDDSAVSVKVFEELFDARYVKAIKSSTLSNSTPRFINPEITLAGREYVDALLSQRNIFKRFMIWLPSNMATVIISTTTSLLTTWLSLKFFGTP